MPALRMTLPAEKEVSNICKLLVYVTVLLFGNQNTMKTSNITNNEATSNFLTQYLGLHFFFLLPNRTGRLRTVGSEHGSI